MIHRFRFISEHHTRYGVARLRRVLAVGVGFAPRTPRPVGKHPKKRSASLHVSPGTQRMRSPADLDAGSYPCGGNPFATDGLGRRRVRLWAASSACRSWWLSRVRRWTWMWMPSVRARIAAGISAAPITRRVIDHANHIRFCLARLRLGPMPTCPPDR